MKKLKVLFNGAIILFSAFLVQCNFTEVREVNRVEYMYFKANGVERPCRLGIQSGRLDGRGGLEQNERYSYFCIIWIDSLAPQHVWIDSNIATYYDKKYYDACGNSSDSIFIEYDSVKECYFGKFSFVAVSRPYTYNGFDRIVTDTTYDTVRITDGVFICSSKKDTVE
jgi:hypothetical protein